VTPTDDLDALDQAVDGFGARLALVADRWTDPTPCDEWDVRWLCAHVLGGNRFAVLILGGASADDALSQVLAMRHIGERPVDDLRDGAVAMRAAFAVPGARQATVRHIVGEITGERFLRLRIYDVLLHTWDLAMALGVDDRLDHDLVGRVLADVDAGLVGAVPCTAEAAAAPGLSDQDRLLVLTGRDPSWTPPRSSPGPPSG
jgi:uncharacterized protein (TIGR03086 family)